jgi:hypothetical protein
VRSKLFFIGIFLLCVTQGCFTADKNSSSNNALSAKEKRAGWQLLFDGKSLKGWRNFGKPDGPHKGWVAENGCLKLQPGSGGGDIITVEEFTDFDLRWEWKVPARANNGVKYLASEGRPKTPGPEYQMIDDTLETDAKRMTASLYDILPPAKNKPSKAMGQWNQSRILVRGNHVEHWLNGAKVLEFELGSAKLNAAIAKSKFKDVENFGKKISGHILLTDHHDEAWYRNIKIRVLTVR